MIVEENRSYDGSQPREQEPTATAKYFGNFFFKKCGADGGGAAHDRFSRNLVAFIGTKQMRNHILLTAHIDLQLSWMKLIETVDPKRAVKLIHDFAYQAIFMAKSPELILREDSPSRALLGQSVRAELVPVIHEMFKIVSRNSKRPLYSAESPETEDRDALARVVGQALAAIQSYFQNERPFLISQILSAIEEKLKPRFPDSQRTAICSMLFLQGVVPALVSTPPKKFKKIAPQNMKILGQILQKLANQSVFEPVHHLSRFNTIIKQNLFLMDEAIEAVSRTKAKCRFPKPSIDQMKRSVERFMANFTLHKEGICSEHPDFPLIKGFQKLYTDYLKLNMKPNLLHLHTKLVVSSFEAESAETKYQKVLTLFHQPVAKWSYAKVALWMRINNLPWAIVDSFDYHEIAGHEMLEKSEAFVARERDQKRYKEELTLLKALNIRDLNAVASYLQSMKLKNWSIWHICVWLHLSKLTSLTPRAVQQAIDGPAILDSTENEIFKALNVQLVGHEKRLRKSLLEIGHRDLRKETS